jgi:hypothetical protein
MERKMDQKAFTVGEFCKIYKVSRGRLHELEQAGLAPKIYRIASKPYVSLTAAQEWLERMESGAAENFKPLPAKNPGQRGRTKAAA